MQSESPKLDAANLKLLETLIRNDIDKVSQAPAKDKFKTRLGASVIGHPCARNLWYSFRWIAPIIHSSRESRLLDRGSKSENRFTAWLRAADIIVNDYDSDGNQYRISGCDGHFGGSMEGVALLPPHYNFDAPILLEYKTSNATQFKTLVKDGVIKARPMHYAQICMYGSQYRLTHCLYICLNKDNDDLHVEIIPINERLAEQMGSKAFIIISALHAPAKISETKTFQTCKQCHNSDVCHSNAPAAKNCRSCVNAIPGMQLSWSCKLHDGIIPTDFISTGCNDWTSII